MLTLLTAAAVALAPFAVPAAADPGPVTSGAFCSAVQSGDTSVTADGTPMTCTSTATDAELRWRSTAPAAATVNACDLLSPQVLDQLRQTPAVQAMIPSGLPDSVIIAAGRARAACTGSPAANLTPAQVKTEVCTALTVGNLDELADRFGATPGVKANITAANVTAARNIVACGDVTAAAPATTAPADPTTAAAATTTAAPVTSTGTTAGSTTAAAPVNPDQVTLMPAGGVNTGEYEAPHRTPGILVGIAAALAVLAGVTVTVIRRRLHS